MERRAVSASSCVLVGDLRRNGEASTASLVDRRVSLAEMGENGEKWRETENSVGGKKKRVNNNIFMKGW